MPNLSNLPQPRVLSSQSQSHRHQKPSPQTILLSPRPSTPSSSHEYIPKTTSRNWFWIHRFRNKNNDKNNETIDTNTHNNNNNTDKNFSLSSSPPHPSSSSSSSSSTLSTSRRIFFQHLLTFIIFGTVFVQNVYTYDGDGIFTQFFYTIAFAATTVSCFFASTFIIGLAAFQPRALLTLLGFGYTLWNIHSLGSATELYYVYSIPMGMSIGIQWSLESSMVLCFYSTENEQSSIGGGGVEIGGNDHDENDGQDQQQQQQQQKQQGQQQQQQQQQQQWSSGQSVAGFWAIWSCLPMVLVLFQTNIWNGVDHINSTGWDTDAGGANLALGILAAMIKVILFWKQYRDVRRMDGSLLQEFQEKEETTPLESIEMLPRAITPTREETTMATLVTTPTTITTTPSSSSKPTPPGRNTNSTISKSLPDRYFSELSMTLRVFIFGQFHLVILLCYSLGYAHQYFIGNQERMLVIDSQSKTLLINVTLLTISRISTGFWFGIRILDPHPDSLNNSRPLLKVSQRVNRGFLVLVVCSVIGWGLTLGQQAYFSKMCLPPYTACDLFNISKSPRLWVLSAGAMIFQGAMESVSFCFVLWMLSLMAGGTFSMATRYTGLMGWSILCGHFTGQVVSTRSIGMSACSYLVTQCVIVGNGLYEGAIAGGLWFVGLIWFAITKEFVQLDELETREIKGEDEVKDGGDVEFEVK